MSELEEDKKYKEEALLWCKSREFEYEDQFIRSVRGKPEMVILYKIPSEPEKSGGYFCPLDRFLHLMRLD